MIFFHTKTFLNVTKFKYFSKYCGQGTLMLTQSVFNKELSQSTTQVQSLVTDCPELSNELSRA